MTEQPVESGEGDVFRWLFCQRGLFLEEVVGEQQDIAAAFA
jgi:hypothetical protein